MPESQTTQAEKPAETKSGSAKRNPLRLLSIPLSLAEDTTLTPTERLACLLLTRWAFAYGEPTAVCWVSNSVLASQLGLKSEVAASRVIRRLNHKGLIRVEHTKAGKMAERRVIYLVWRELGVNIEC